MAALAFLSLAAPALLLPRAAARALPLVRCCAPVDGVEPAAAPIDPRKAVEELGGLLEQIKVLWTESASWSADERVERRRELINTYVRVFAPALAFSGTQVAISLGAFLTVLLGLQLGGRGYADVYRLSGALRCCAPRSSSSTGVGQRGDRAAGRRTQRAAADRGDARGDAGGHRQPSGKIDRVEPRRGGPQREDRGGAGKDDRLAQYPYNVERARARYEP